jgi:hypothetical protein
VFNYAQFRDWHLWIGLILLIPVSTIAVTGFLWNHEKTLGIKVEEKKYEAMEPDHHKSQQSQEKEEATPVSFVAQAGAWDSHRSAIDSALEEARREWGNDVELERIELKQEHDLGLVVKVKVHEDLGLRPYEIIWSAEQGRVVERKGDPKNGTDWAKIIHDLHTGKFFSKQYGFIWSDASALAIVALGITGVVLYVIPLWKKANKEPKKPAPAASNKAPAGGDDGG